MLRCLSSKIKIFRSVNWQRAARENELGNWQKRSQKVIEGGF